MQNIHGKEHTKSLIKIAKTLIEKEKLVLDKDSISEMITYHDKGIQKYGYNPVTYILDGMLSAQIYRKELKEKYKPNVYKAIKRHPRLLWFLGPKIDKLLYKPESAEVQSEHLYFDWSKNEFLKIK